MPITKYVLQQLYPDFRLRVTPDEPTEGPRAIVEQRPRGSMRPHTDMMVAKVRHLIEHTDLPYREITAKTGVSAGTITTGCATSHGNARRTRRVPPIWCRTTGPAVD